MFNQYNPQLNIERLKKQRDEIDNLIKSYQSIPQQPMNVFNVGNTSQVEFEARFLNENENPNEILIQRKTMFFSPKNGKLYIKEINGDITSYDVILPKDEKDLKIEELERKLKEYEFRNDTTNNENGKSYTSNNSKDESNAKGTSK